jgi:hypothetical protein
LSVTVTAQVVGEACPNCQALAKRVTLAELPLTDNSAVYQLPAWMVVGRDALLRVARVVGA